MLKQKVGTEGAMEGCSVMEADVPLPLLEL
jgi:hypothetical protein